MAARPGAGTPARLLEEAAGGSAGCAGTAHRPAAAGCAELPGGLGIAGFADVRLEGGSGAGTGRRRYPVHDVAGGIPVAVVTLERTERRGGRFADRRAHRAP